ncbi:hypothetical protein Zmor_015909 [Zophobas morio]|uniref:MD-2-related lipid-recognition domain-containing protein n=2 Tax=Zophobas morio TaxID=2755281 RepID=A0AA38IP90_9CUCU|nr:hypothetical protein Zmor_015909 [Zophobas morio]
MPIPNPKIIFAIIYFSYMISVRATNVTQCTLFTDVPVPDNVEIGNCDEPPCIVPINSTINIAMNFTSPRTLGNIFPIAIGDTFNSVINFPLEEEDACDGIVNTECPLEEGEDVEYKSQISVSSDFGEIYFSLEYYLFDRDAENFFECFKVDIQMVLTD